jgi:methylenetetrahydrofolate dehydrogenase (NADP+) / methenyltetrahydrofolate cyclohydrolase
MSAHILDGKKLAAQLKEELKTKIAAAKHRTAKHPHLVSILIGEDTASQSYALSQQRAAESIGIHYELQKMPAKVSQSDVLALIQQLNGYDKVHGVIINKPLPDHIYFQALMNGLSPEKDVEGMTLINVGRLFLGEPGLVPCTPAAAMALLKFSGEDLKGKKAVVLGRSDIVGKPIALLLLKEDITVTVCHSKTIGLLDHVRQADIVVAAMGKKRFVQGDWIKPNAIIIDVGINDDHGKIAGDVDFDSCALRASYITPVPGGVGPVTSVMLMNNVVEAFKRQINLS